MRGLMLALVLCASSVQAQQLVVPKMDGATPNPRVFFERDASGSAGIDGAQLSPDGARVALYGHDAGDPNGRPQPMRGIVQIWDVKARHQLFELVGHRAWVQLVVWSRDGKSLASQSQDGMIVLWDSATGKQRHVLAPAVEKKDGAQEWMERLQRPNLLGFSRDGTQVLALAARLDSTAMAKAKNADGKAPQLNDFLLPILQAWNSDDGKLMRAVPAGKNAGLERRAVIDRAGENFVQPLARYGTSENADTVEIRDLQTGALRDTLRIDAPFNYVLALSSDGSRVLAIPTDDQDASRGRAQVWDVKAKKALQVLAVIGPDFGGAQFSLDNTKLLVSTSTGAIEIFDIASGQREHLLSGAHCGPVTTLQMTPDHHTLLSLGAGGGPLQMWDLTLPDSSAPMPRALAEVSNVRRIFFAPDGSFWCGWGESNWEHEDRGNYILVTNQTGKSVELRHFAADGKEIEKISLPEKFIVDQVTFSPDFRLAAGSLATQPQPAVISGEGIGVWEIATQKLLWHLPGKGMMMDTMAFAPDGQTLAVNSSENSVQLWDMRTGQLLRTLLEPDSEINALCFAPDGQTLAIGTRGGTITLFDLRANEVSGEIAEDSLIYQLAFSPDGKYLLSGGEVRVTNAEQNRIIGFKVRVWDVETRRVWREREQDGRLFGGAAFSPDGRTLALCHFDSYEHRADARVELWDLQNETSLAILRDVCGAEHPAFSPDGKSVFTTDGGWIKSWQLSDVLAQNVTP